jgi:hypothetical protein
MSRPVKILIGVLLLAGWYMFTNDERPYIDPALRDSLISAINLPSVIDAVTGKFLWRFAPTPILLPFLIYQFRRWRREKPGVNPARKK